MDVYKISDAIELIPPLDAMTVRRILRTAYEHWLALDGFIDPHPNREQSGDKLGLRHADDLVRYMRSLDRNEPSFGLTDLVSTPRALKRLVCDVDTTWEHLKGEAELDDIIAVNALRHAAEPVIDFLSRNIDVARADHERSSRREPQNAERLEAEWNALLSRLNHPRAVQSLVDLLGLKRLTAGHGITGDLSPQDASNYEPTDYFRRILSRRIAEGELRDQTVLRDVKDWRNKTSDRMIAGLVNSDEANDRYARVWEHFAPSQLAPEELPPIASEIYRRMLRREGATVLFGKAPASIAVWRRMNTARRDRWTDWLIGEIRSALPISLLFATDLYYWFGSVRHGIVSTNDRARARTALVDSARAVYSDASTLIRALSVDQPFAITKFIAPRPTEEPQDTIPLQDLHWFAELLADAARIRQELIIPDVVVTFGEHGHRFEREDDEKESGLVQTYRLDRRRFLDFFGERTDEMIDMIADFTTELPVVLSAQPQVRAWQAERSGGTNPQRRL